MKERIREIFENSGLNQSHFAKSIEITRAYCSQLLSGKRTPSTKTVRLIAEIYGYRQEWILTGEGPKKSDESTAEIERLVQKYALTDKGAALLRVYFDMTPEKRAALENFVLTLVDGGKKE